MKDTVSNKVKDLPNESWIIIKNYLIGIDGKYAASNYGRIKRIIREVVTHRKGKWVISEKIMPQRNDSRGSNGYMRVMLSIGHTCRLYLVHRLIAHCFYSIENEKEMQVNHKDFNTHNNNSENLEWVTREQNNNHYQNSLINKMNNGERVSNYRFTKDEVVSIFLDKRKMKEISNDLKVNWKTIKDIKLKRIYKPFTNNLPNNNPRRKRLKKDEILDIYANRHLPVKDMEEKYGIKQGCIIAVRTGRRYSDITGHNRTLPLHL